MISGEGVMAMHSEAARSVDFCETVGLLWYTLFSASMLHAGPFRDRSKRNSEHTIEKGEGGGGGGGVSDADASFEKWGEVDWVLLAAHVYVLTRQLRTESEVRRLVVHDIFAGRFHGSGEAMRTALSTAHARLLTSYAQGEGEEEERATAASGDGASGAATSPVSPSPFRSATSNSAAEFTAGGATCGRPPTTTSAQTCTLPNASTNPAATAVTAAGAVGAQSGSRALHHSGAHALPSPATAGIRGPPLSSSPALSAEHTSASAAAVHATPFTSTSSSSAQLQSNADVPLLDNASPTVQQRATREGDAHAAAAAAGGGGGGHSLPAHWRASSSASPSSPSAVPPSFRSGSSNAAASSVANQAGDGGVRRCEVSGEPDPLDAPWYTLWCSLPTEQARMHLQRLRHHTLLPIEDFSSLLEQFFMVDGADDFLAPVHAATIMEFAGVRSGPYHTIVRVPLSLAEVRRYITESHRHYTRAAAVAPAEAEAMVRWTTSRERRVLTIAELERSLWHIAANCVLFNAPESRYPRTARRFAASCIEAIIRYCEKQMAAFLAA